MRHRERQLVPLQHYLLPLERRMKKMKGERHVC